MVLILTDKFDVHADAVIELLNTEKLNFFRLNLDVESLMKTHITFENDIWTIGTGDKEIKSSMVDCVWCRRPFVELSLQEQENSEVDFKIWKNEWNKTLIGLHNTLKTVPWLNPLRKAYKGENKYYQMEVAKEIGFNFPETLVSNDKENIRRFIEKNGKILFKLMSQEIYDVGINDFRGLYTNVIDIEDIEGFKKQGENPIVIQKYIDKKYEVRYTVVGKEHLACKIDSQYSEIAKEDWRRYDITNTPHYRMEVPLDIKKKVSLLMKKLGIEYGALDFIVTPNDKWFFLEINCMGQWLWIEQLTGLPISKAIVTWIKNNDKEVF